MFRFFKAEPVDWLQLKWAKVRHGLMALVHADKKTLSVIISQLESVALASDAECDTCPQASEWSYYSTLNAATSNRRAASVVKILQEDGSLPEELAVLCFTLGVEQRKATFVEILEHSIFGE